MTDTTSKKNGTLAYDRVAKGLREEILTGKYAPGTRLPTTHALAEIWNSSYFTIHTALTQLVKQGWVERVHGHGTFVARAGKKFLRAGIYHSINIWSDPEAMFARQLNKCLVERLQAMNKETEIFVESRSERNEGDLPPELVDAIYNRRIQCLIAANLDAASATVLQRLSMPVAMMTSSTHRAAVRFDDRAFIRESIRHLALQGCRSVGVISNFTPMDDYFLKDAKAAGLTTRKEWILHPSRYRNPLTEFGYHAFRRLHEQRRRPDGLIVYPDLAARGVILAILQCRTRIPEEMKLIFHGNAHIPLVCPFPVTWAVYDEDEAAGALIAIIEQQFAGHRAAPVTVPLTFKSDDGGKWLT